MAKLSIKDISIGKKLVGIGIGLTTLILVFLFSGFLFHEREQIVADYVEKARVISLIAESTRQEMEHKWELGLIDTALLRSYAEQGNREAVLAGVPVISAWNAAQRKAAEGGYQFRTPKFSPRNPENSPDELEARALNTMKSQGLKEYYEIDETMNAVRYFRPVVLSEICLNCHGDPARSQSLWGNNRGLDPTGGPMENWKLGEVHGAFEIIQSLDKAQADMASSLTMGGVGVLGGLVLYGLVFILLMNKIIFRPLGLCESFAAKLASGDTTQLTGINQADEIGSLASSLDRMSASIGSTIVGIAEHSEVIASAAEELSISSGQMSDGAETVSGQTNSIAVATEEMSVNINSVSDSAGVMASSVSTVATAIEEMSSSLSEVAGNCEQAARIANDADSQARHTNEAMERLNASAVEIDKVLDTISDIADQTNLLALNATIEAASAGEAGKGFAVVANEVKELAKQTAQATEEIGRQIEEMQANTEGSVGAIKGISNIISEMNGITTTIANAVEEQSVTINEIASSMVGASQGAESITRGIEEAAKGADEISVEVQGINQAARDTAAGATLTNDSAGELARLSTELKETVGQFKICE